MAEESIYVTLVYLYKNESSGRLLRLQAGPTYVSVREILKQFGIVKLANEDKIWIKRENEDECRPDNYELYLSLEWRKFDRCTIVISPTYPKSSSLINNGAKSIQDNCGKTYEESVKEQLRIWEEKHKRREDRAGRIPRTIKTKNRAKTVIVRKKRKKRIEAEKAELIAEKKENPDN